MTDLGKLLVLVGVMVTVIGILLWSGMGRGWLGRLPGDIQYTKGNFSFYFPIITCLLASVVLSLILWLLRR